MGDSIGRIYDNYNEYCQWCKEKGIEPKCIRGDNMSWFDDLETFRKESKDAT